MFATKVNKRRRGACSKTYYVSKENTMRKRGKIINIAINTQVLTSPKRKKRIFHTAYSYSESLNSVAIARSYVARQSQFHTWYSLPQIKQF